MAWRSFESITPTSTGSLVFFWPWVSSKLLPSGLGSKVQPSALHLYYKLAYIGLAWGGVKEQDEELAVGNMYAKNWQDECYNLGTRLSYCQID